MANQNSQQYSPGEDTLECSERINTYEEVDDHPMMEEASMHELGVVAKSKSDDVYFTTE